MKKIALYLAAIAILVTSCDNKKYTISGDVKDNRYENTYVYLKEINEEVKKSSEQPNQAKDSALITNGKFSFNGIAERMAILSLDFTKLDGEKMAKSVLLVAEPGEINVLIDSTSSTIKGTAKNDEYQTFITEMRNFQEKKKVLYNQYRENDGKDKELEEQLDTQYENIDKEEKEVVYNFIKANINEPLGIYLFQRNGSMLESDKTKWLLATLPDEKREYESIKKLDSYVKAIENTAKGKHFVEIKGEDPNGNTIALSDYAGKGKYVLIDFWASWCSPCRKDMPELVKLYGQYKNKGLEIVGVSLDRDKESWLAGLNSMKMTWPQITDLKFWEAQGAQDYAVRSIPHTVLIDKDGTIIARGLRGEELADKLAELMN